MEYPQFNCSYGCSYDEDEGECDNITEDYWWPKVSSEDQLIIDEIRRYLANKKIPFHTVGRATLICGGTHIVVSDLEITTYRKLKNEERERVYQAPVSNPESLKKSTLIAIQGYYQNRDVEDADW